ncbi:hypothetical protein AAVH_31124 [Aphelenchoides avenae]|nr:hypothetical protein AAVH_31124 [Aphelenchus avenae]
MPNGRDGLHILCKPCEKLMFGLQKSYPTLDGITREAFDLAIKAECSSLTHGIPFMDQLCDKIGDHEVDVLYNLIMKEGAKIDPNKDCRAIKFC